MSKFKYAILHLQNAAPFAVEFPATHLYQLTALHQRLHKELAKLTAGNVPPLADVVAECERLEPVGTALRIVSGLDYINGLERSFSAIEERSYPLISLLTEIRALQAQLEQWYEEELEEA
jgi:hypothetical protein